MGFEPTTTGITIRYSNQLSYAHHCQNICRTIDNLGAPDRTRTCNRRLRRPMLYPVELRARARSLAHRSCLDSALRFAPIEVVGVEGFELSTSSSQSWRSTRLSYTPPTPAYSCRTAAESAKCASDHRGSPASINTSFFYTATGHPAASLQNKKGAEAPFAYLARPERFELPTTKFVAWYSIQLSYGREEAELYSVCVRCLKPVMPENKKSSQMPLPFVTPRDATRNIHVPRPAGSFRCTNRQSCRFVEPRGFAHAAFRRKEREGCYSVHPCTSPFGHLRCTNRLSCRFVEPDGSCTRHSPHKRKRGRAPRLRFWRRGRDSNPR